MTTKVENSAVQLVNAMNVRRIWSGIFVNVKEYGAVGDGVTDDYEGLQAAIDATPKGGTLFFPRANYKSTRGLVIDKEINIKTPGYSPSALTGLFFDLDARPNNEPAILVNSSIDRIEFSGFYLLNLGASARLSSCVHDGIYFKGVSGSAPINMIWNAKVDNVTVDGFRHGFRGENLLVPKFENCRAVTCGDIGYLFNIFSTGISMINCYSERNAGIGIHIEAAAYPTLLNCQSDSNLIGFNFKDSSGVNAYGLASEECLKHAVRSEASKVNINGLTTVASGSSTETPLVPTMVYVVSGTCMISGLMDFRLASPSIRQYSVVGEVGATVRITSHAELLPYLLSYSGKSSVNGQMQSSGLPTATGWTAEYVGQIVYDAFAVEAGTSPNKYIIYGWRRMTTGNGNVLNVDWLPLRSLTGN